MKKGYVGWSAAVLLVACSIALGRKKAPKPDELGAELAKAPARANSLKNPYAASPEAFWAGKKLFQQHCAECHGLEGRGQNKAPDLHSPVIHSASPGTLFWFLKNGNRSEGMPSWSRLPDPQLWQLVTYVQRLY